MVTMAKDKFKSERFKASRFGYFVNRSSLSPSLETLSRDVVFEAGQLEKIRPLDDLEKRHLANAQAGRGTAGSVRLFRARRHEAQGHRMPMSVYLDSCRYRENKKRFYEGLDRYEAVVASRPLKPPGR